MALCLTRTQGQRLVFSRPEIKITVLSVKGKSVRFAIDAPKHIRVMREELIYRSSPPPAPTTEGAT